MVCKLHLKFKKTLSEVTRTVWGRKTKSTVGRVMRRNGRLETNFKGLQASGKGNWKLSSMRQEGKQTLMDKRERSKALRIMSASSGGKQASGERHPRPVHLTGTRVSPSL